MKGARPLALLVLLALAVVAGWWFLRPQPHAQEGQLVVYYAKLDGATLGQWTVSTRPAQAGESDAEHLHNLVVYAAVQAVAGPPSDVQAIRFPAGTHVISAGVADSTATVDLSQEVTAVTGGSFAENGEFKGLVYTLTGIPSINAVQILVAGRKVESLPGGHLELDTPLRRSDW
jgi:spore germination protein GerM